MKRPLRPGVVICAGLVWLLAGEFGNWSSAEENKTPGDDHLRPLLLEIVKAADRFRVQAASNAKDAIARHGIEGFPEKWAQDVDPHFRGEEWQLTHFFAYSVILVGRADPPKCVVAFYNPWVDGVLLTAWRDRRADGWKATDFLFCLGETLRGEKPSDSLCPAWLKSGKPAAGSVIEVCGRTVSAFQKTFPLEGSFQYPVIEAPAVPHTELSTLKARMKFSLAYVNGRAVAAERREALDKALREAIPVLARGDKGAILALTSKDQDPYVAETICMLPQNIREGFVPHWAIEQPPMIAVVLSNAEIPRWFVLLFLDSSQGKPIRALGLYDFESVGAPPPAPAH